jgi:hypothetical protein
VIEGNRTHPWAWPYSRCLSESGRGSDLRRLDYAYLKRPTFVLGIWMGLLVSVASRAPADRRCSKLNRQGAKIFGSLAPQPSEARADCTPTLNSFD